MQIHLNLFKYYQTTRRHPLFIYEHRELGMTFNKTTYHIKGGNIHLDQLRTLLIWLPRALYFRINGHAFTSINTI